MRSFQLLTCLAFLAVNLPASAEAPGAAPVVVSSSTAPMHGILNGKGSATLLHNASTGSKEASLSVLVLQGGAEVPEHVHETSVELLYVEEGRVEMVVGGKAVSASAGDAIRIPAGVKHSARVPPGNSAARAVQVYVGPGPEQRFTAGPRLNPPPMPGK
ncbi:MAG: cupin domain-containing protein [Myxococcota bacterium]